MKTKISIFILLLVLAMSVQPALAQTATTNTTLSAAVTDDAATFVLLASLTGVQNNGSIYVDHELMSVIGTPAAGAPVHVRRGAGGTRASMHANSAVVYVATPGDANRRVFRAYDLFGACTATNEMYLPVWNFLAGTLFDCRGSIWLPIQANGTMGSNPYGQAQGFCTGTVGSAETEFLNGAACSGATTATYRYTVASPGYLSGLRVFSSANFTGGTNKDVMTVFKNGVATTLTCTAAAATAACSDTTHSVVVVAGDVITFQFVTATSDTAANVAASVMKH